MNKQIKKYRLQGKTSDHRDLLIKNLVMDLVRSEKIKTTPAKAKIIKSKLDKLVTTAKKNEGNRKFINSFFASNDFAVNKFYKLIEEKFADRNSGYSRIIRTLPRKGDNADQVFLMLVNTEIKSEKSEVEKLLEKQEEKKSKKSVVNRVKKAVTKTKN